MTPETSGRWTTVARLTLRLERPTAGALVATTPARLPVSRAPWIISFKCTTGTVVRTYRSAVTVGSTGSVACPSPAYLYDHEARSPS